MGPIEESLKLFEYKFHCSQAVFAAFSEELNLNKEQALKIGACFGSGMSKGEVCGACTGALMVLGLKYGHCTVGDTESKLKTDEITDKFLDEFKKENGSYLYKELLNCDISTKEGRDYAIEHNLFTNLCPKMVESASKITKKLIK